MNAKNRPMSSFEEILVYSKGKTANGSNPKMKYFPQGLIRINKTAKNSDSTWGNNAHDWNKPDNYFQEFTNYPNDVLKFNQDKDGMHPTQKPVALFEYLIKTYTCEGDLVLDNCMGSGTTAVACMNTDRNFIGFEKEKEYFDKANVRIAQNTHQLELI